MPRRSLVIATTAGGAVLAVCAGLGIWAYAQRPQVTGSAQQWYRTSAPQVLLPVENASSLGSLHATLDGRKAVLLTTGKGLEVELDGVADGTHRVHVEASPSRIFGDSVDASFAIHVDTHRPQ